jgi:hypothetical protein
LASAVTVDFMTFDRSASNGVDYLGTNGTLTFEAGQTNASFEVALIDNSSADIDRTVSLALTNVTGGGVLGGAQQRHAHHSRRRSRRAVRPGRMVRRRSGHGAVVIVVRSGPTNDAVKSTSSSPTGRPQRRRIM